MARVSAAERRRARQMRNNDPLAIERAKNFVFTSCDICTREMVVNNNLEQKVELNKYKGFVLCSRCRCVYRGKLLLGGTIDWAKRYVQMYLLLKQIAEGGEVPTKKITKLVKAMDDERPRRRLYRKRQN